MQLTVREQVTGASRRHETLLQSFVSGDNKKCSMVGRCTVTKVFSEFEQFGVKVTVSSLASAELGVTPFLELAQRLARLAALCIRAAQQAATNFTQHKRVLKIKVR